MKISSSALLLVLAIGTPLTQAQESNSEMQQAIAAFNADNFEDAKLLLDQQPESASKFLYLGKIAYQQKDLEQAEALFEEAVDLDKQSAEAQYMLGSVSMKLAATASIFSAPGYASTAKESLAKAIELDPSHVDAMVALSQFYAYAPSIVGGDIDKAEELAMQIAKYSKLESLYVYQMIYRNKEAKDQLLELSQQLLSEYSESSEAVLTAGFILQDLTKYEEAFKAFERSRSLERKDKDDLSPEYALFQIGKTAVLSESRLDEGVEALQQYIALQKSTPVPSVDWAEFRLAQIKLLQGEKKQALAMAKKLKGNTEDDDLVDELKGFIKQAKKS